MGKFCGVLMVVALSLMVCSCGDILYNAKIGNTERIQKGLDAGAPIDKRDHAGNTPLMIATIAKQHETIEYLCKKGANLNARNDNGATALILAAYYNHIDAAEILVKFNADKNIKDKYGNTALYYAERFEYPRMIAVLKKG